MYIKICSYCGKQYTTRKKKQKYCSPDCQHKAISKPKTGAICQVCGTAFIIGRESKGLCCSWECQKIYTGKVRHNKAIKKQQEQKQKELMYQELKQRYKELKQRYYSAQNKMNHIKCCAECGKQFIARDIQTLCCSKKCSNKRKNKRHDKRIYRNGKPDLSISLTKLYMRDMGICQLCGKHIDFDCDSNSNDYPSIDHIKPIAKGGLHSWDNVQLACRGCNSAKSDKI